MPAGYDPFLGRFLSEDPIGLAGGINQYAYAGNDPVNRSDPSGLHHVCEQTSWGTGSIGEGTYKIHFVSGCWDFGHGPANRFEDGDPPANPSSCLIAGCRLRNADDQRGERDFVEETLEGIRQDNDFCAEMRARGIAAMYRDLRFWDHAVIYKNPQGRPEQMFGNAPFDSRVGGPVLYFDARYLTRHKVAHEAVHTVPRRHSNLANPTPYSDYSRTPLGSIDQTAAYCLRSR
ncbi:MAG TPA: RHS repeat-associated core domain-containing protein [Longimicrobium sp.]|nr:RHS repeat-associated core domain-containing protein [Longimicrobium sp.]